MAAPNGITQVITCNGITPSGNTDVPFVGFVDNTFQIRTPNLVASVAGVVVTFSDTVDIAVSTGTGTKIGTATTQKLGFYNVTPIAQRSGGAQAAVATTGATNSSPYGYTAASQADAIVTLVNELRAWAVAQGFIKGAA